MSSFGDEAEILCLHNRVGKERSSTTSQNNGVPQAGYLSMVTAPNQSKADKRFFAAGTQTR